MPKLPRVTEQDIRQVCTPRSFERGEDYYHRGAIRNPIRQGLTLRAECEGSRWEPYQVTVELTEAGIGQATCTCPYDWGGYCKHIVALLLTWLHAPDSFTVLEETEALLARMSRDELTAIILEMLERRPDGYHILLGRATGEARRRCTRVDVSSYQWQVGDAFSGDTDWYGMERVMEKLHEVQRAARKFAGQGEARDALAIYTVLLAGCVENIRYCDDSSGGLSFMIEGCGEGLAELARQAEMTTEERRRWLSQLVDLFDEAAAYGVERGVTRPVLAAYQPEDAPFLEQRLQALVEAKAGTYYHDHAARFLLGFYERQGRTDDYLDLCYGVGLDFLYVRKLIEVDRLQEAIAHAQEHLTRDDHCLEVAEALDVRGETLGALAVAERGLASAGWREDLPHWLGDRYRELGRAERALEVYRSYLAEHPTVETYTRLKEVAKELNRWDELRPGLIARLRGKHPHALVRVFLWEGQVRKAMELVQEREMTEESTLLQVAQAARDKEPDWAIECYQRIAQGYIDRVNRKAYRTAARYLAQAKEIYRATGRLDQWAAYIEKVRAENSNRPALQEEFQGL